MKLFKALQNEGFYLRHGFRRREGWEYKRVTADDLVLASGSLHVRLLMGGWRLVPELTQYGLGITYWYVKPIK